MYGALDPIFMIMLMRTLGPDFVVWDKAATIRFLRPGRTTLRATFRLSETLLAEVRDDARASGPIERDLQVDLVDADGQVHATCTKTLHVRWKPSRDGAGT